MQGMIIRMFLKGLGPLGGLKTYIGIALIALEAVLRYMDASHPALPIIAAVMVGLGVGDKMGKERADPKTETVKEWKPFNI